LSSPSWLQLVDNSIQLFIAGLDTTTSHLVALLADLADSPQVGSGCAKMDICNPPDVDMVAQAVLHWAGSCRQQFLHAGATVQNTSMHCFRTTPLGEESRPHPHLRAGLRFTQSLVLSMARFRLSSHNLGVELGRHQGVVWFVCGCKRCAALEMHDLPVDDEAHLLFLCPATAVVRRERRFAQLPFTSLPDLMCCCDVFTGWHYLCTSA
jgi:hypothetical protein